MAARGRDVTTTRYVSSAEGQPEVQVPLDGRHPHPASARWAVAAPNLPPWPGGGWVSWWQPMSLKAEGGRGSWGHETVDDIGRERGR